MYNHFEHVTRTVIGLQSVDPESEEFVDHVVAAIWKNGKHALEVMRRFAYSKWLVAELPSDECDIAYYRLSLIDDLLYYTHDAHFHPARLERILAEVDRAILETRISITGA